MNEIKTLLHQNAALFRHFTPLSPQQHTTSELYFMLFTVISQFTIDMAPPRSYGIHFVQVLKS